VRISVAMAARDSARFLEPLLDSLARQTQLPHELVVYDDASSDATPAIVARFAASAPFPVRVERGDAHAGHVAGFFRAASLCDGDAVALCDADDVWLPDKLAVCARELTRSGALLALHSTRIVDRDLRDLGRTWPKIDATRTVPPLGRTGLDLISPGMAMAFRPSLLDAVDPHERPRSRYHDGPMFHDEWLHFIAGVLGSIVVIATPLVLYRQHESNDSGGWFDERRRLQVAPVVENYRTAAELTREWAAFLADASRRSPSHADRLEAGALHYARSADQWALRVALYDAARRRRRARIVTKLLSTRAYRPREEGGFGRTALGKDVAAGVVWRLTPGQV
jgi:glycosyltransferase involved in cell wall biosynthesis